MHLPDIITDLGFILIAAALVSLLFKKLKQPVVLGYLLAGFLVGPNWAWFPTVSDTESVKVWAEIGVIFLLFGLGLEFNFKKLSQVGKSSSIIASFEVIFMLAAGFLTGRVLGWNNKDSLFLGGMLAISSTTIIVRSFEELGVKTKQYVSIVFGVLVIEDLFAILLMALLTTFSLSKNFSGMDLVFSIGKLGFFLTLWFAIGIYFLPSFFKKIQNYLNEETLLVTSVGLCLLMVILATKVDFSPALGAFLMGSLLAETTSGKNIEKLLHPIKDLFGAIFFVSIGMLIDPKALVQYGPHIILISIVTIVGKIISTSLGALISGTSLKNSVKVGFSLAQIGEFSFIIATLGLSLNVTSEFLYPIAVTVSAITTFLTPYLIKNSENAFQYLEKKTPAFILQGIERYQLAINKEQTNVGIIDILWKAFGWRSLLSSVFILALFHGAKSLSYLWTTSETNLSPYSNLSITIALTVLAAPFFWALALKKPSQKLTLEELARIKNLTLGIMIVRIAFSLALTVYVYNLIIPIKTLPLIVLVILTALLITLSFFSSKIFKKMETRFVENLNTHTESPEKKSQALSPWDGGLYEFAVHPNSHLVGKTLQDLAFRARFNSTVVLVERGEIQYLAPNKNWVLMPFDKLKLLSTDEQFESIFKEYESSITANLNNIATEKKADYGLSSFIIEPHSPLCGLQIKESKIRDKIEGIIVGIEREQNRIINPGPDTVLKAQDIVWIVGNLKKTESIKVL
jgi:CPA2 family monovalent cation:H+ antiporter-2